MKIFALIAFTSLMLAVCATLAMGIHFQMGYGPNEVSLWGIVAVLAAIGSPVSLLGLRA